MTSSALAAYCTDAHPCSREFEASPGPICLYGCRGYRVADISFNAATDDTGTINVAVVISTTKTGSGENVPDQFPGSLDESLYVGSGRPVGSSRAAKLVITAATTSA